MADGSAIQPPLKAYEDALNRGEIIYQECGDCEHVAFYPRLVCPECGSTNVEYKPSAGKGEIYTRTVIHSRNRDPYNVVLIDMDEGFRIMSTVEDAPNDDVQIGMRVELKTVYPVEEPNAKAGQLPKHVFRPEGG
tara:strand:- start:3406 stop:3810 length:405 start_codon:yes stop_codon:yes gene_type:complete